MKHTPGRHGTIKQGSLPEWNGASAVYSRAYRMLENMAKLGHAQVTYMGVRTGHKVHVSEDMKNVIDALNSGSEERIKYQLLLGNQYGWI